MSDRRLEMVLEMLKNDPNDVFLIYAAALEYKKAGNTDNALQLLEKIVDKFPGYLGAYYTLGKMYEERGEFERAIEVYKIGKKVAKEQNDEKTIGELTEALMLLDDEEENW